MCSSGLTLFTGKESLPLKSAMKKSSKLAPSKASLTTHELKQKKDQIVSGVEKKKVRLMEGKKKRSGPKETLLGRKKH